jgi:23S rRNA (guanosine2251-2'-O)-methyltransferase
MNEYIYGKNAVIMALQQGFPIEKVFLSPSLKDYEFFVGFVKEKSPNTVIEPMPRYIIERKAHHIRSGGICALLPNISPFNSVMTLITTLESHSEKPLIVVLDEIQDPHNFGAIIRSVYGAGFHGVVYQKRRQVGVTAVVASTSAGTCFKIPLCEVTNVARTLVELKKSGYWIYGTDSEANVSLYNAEFVLPLAVILGSEGYGMKRIVRSHCDEIVSIPLSGGLESLNASVAAGVILFEIKRRLTKNG